MQFASSQSLKIYPGSWRIRLPTPTLVSLFPANLRGISRSSVPCICEQYRFILSQAYAYFRVRGRLIPASSVRRRRSFLPWISCLHRDIHSPGPLCIEFPTARYRSVLSVPPALDGLLPKELLGLISSRSHVRGSPYKGFPCCQAMPSLRRPLPS